MIYARVSLADAGTSTLEEGLELCRRRVRGRHEIVAEFSDSTHLPKHARPGLRALRRLVSEDSTIRLLVVPALHQAFRGPKDLVVTWGDWLKRQPPMRLMAINDLVDTTDAIDRARLEPAVRTLRAFAKSCQGEATKAGLMNAARSTAGLPVRPRLALDQLEIRDVWTEGLSYTGMLKRLGQRGIKISRGGLHGRIRQMLEAGSLPPRGKPVQTEGQAS